MSQAVLPLKGLHFMLAAMSEILKLHPDAHLYVAGIDITGGKTVKEKLKVSAYGKYINKLIKKYNLRDSVSFTGSLSEKEICKQFLLSHVFVSPSTIENESNSLSEAKLLGVPSVASFAGGVADRIQNGVDGFIYQHDAPYMAAYYISKIFNDDNLALKLSKNATKTAANINNKELNTARIIEIYNSIIQGIKL